MRISKIKNWRIGNLLTKMIVAAALMFSFSIHMAQPASAATVVTYPTPSYFTTSTAYSLQVDSTTVKVVKHFDYSFAQLSYNGTATFKVTAKDNITSYNISPHSYGITASVSGKDLTFTLPQAGSRYLVIKINNLENLVIMADPVETDAPVPNGGSVKNIMDYSGIDNTGGNLMTSKIQQAINDANARSGGGMVYFPAGIYKFSQVELKSNVTLYLAAGAILRGSTTLSDYDFTDTNFKQANIRIVGASNVAIKGRGMIDSNGTSLTTGDSGPNRENIIRSYKNSSGTKPSGLTFEGITLRDGTTWNMNIEESTNVTITNVKIINNVHWIHGDGFDLVNTSHAVVDQCFAYTGDDVFDAKSSTEEPMTDVVYKNSVAYTESAGTKAGVAGNASLTDLWFINIDVILGYRGISLSHDEGNGIWNDIHFIDIRTEKIFDNGPNGQYRTAPLLIWTAKYKTEVGPISNVELTRITYEDLGNFHSIIQGYDSTSKVSNVNFTNLKMNGTMITNPATGLIDMGANTSNITFNTAATNYMITNANSGKTVEVFGGGTSDGTKIVQWNYHAGTNQRWELVDAGGGYYKIKNVKSGKLLEVTGGSTANGALVEQWGDNGGTNQQWQIVDVGNGYSKLINRKSGKALDSSGSTEDGAQLTQWTDNGGDNQKFQFFAQ
ncbi:RICIN domain-containing protein [Paenibacillus alba]|uniref:RICIN domain-containing protein n=1 Tax=Paenibacillus alba TaxID=1197127 RepID=UPI001563DE0B|nr:RICIN domain-containing protein [Paenibacillus alba]NQX66467.1 RICIN domain-containing protein [Paenibacillus alba]